MLLVPPAALFSPWAKPKVKPSTPVYSTAKSVEDSTSPVPDGTYEAVTLKPSTKSPLFYS